MSFTLAGWKLTSSGNYIVYAKGHTPQDGSKVNSLASLPADMKVRLLKFKKSRGTSSGYGYNRYTYGAEMYNLTDAQLLLLERMEITTLVQLVTAYQSEPALVTKAANKGRCSTGESTFKTFMDELLKNAKHLADPEWTPPVVIKLGLDTVKVQSLAPELNPDNYDASVMEEVRKNVRAHVVEELETILADAVSKALKARENKAKKDLAKVKALKAK